MKELRERLAMALAEYMGVSPEKAPSTEDWLNKWTATLLGGVPIPMLLYCPKCNTQHVDFAEPGWDNPPHRTHYCKAIIDGVACAHNWRPSDYYTTGIQATDSKGIADGFTQPGGARTTVLEPSSVIALAENKGIKNAAGHIALNIGARLLLGKTKPGRWVQNNFDDTLTTFEHKR